MSLLQKAFAGRTSPKARGACCILLSLDSLVKIRVLTCTSCMPAVAMILASNLIVAPIQLSVYLGSLAVINGATSINAIIKFVQMQIMGVMKVAWVTGPASLLVAQKFLPAETWVPFFSFVNFILGESSSLSPLKDFQDRTELTGLAFQTSQEPTSIQRSRSSRLPPRPRQRQRRTQKTSPPKSVSLSRATFDSSKYTNFSYHDQLF